MLLKLKRAMLIGSTVYSAGDVAEVADEQTSKRLLERGHTEVTTTEAPVENPEAKAEPTEAAVANRKRK